MRFVLYFRTSAREHSMHCQLQPPRLIAAFAMFALMAGCSTGDRDDCMNDDDCPQGERCEVEQGVCLEATTDGGDVDAGTGLVVRPAAVAFGPVNVGVVSEERVEVSNRGPDPIELKSLTVTNGTTEITIAREWLTDCEGAPRREPLTVLAVGECTRFAVRLLPRQQAHEIGGSIRLETDDALRPVLDIPVTATAVAPAIKVCALRADGTLDPAMCTSLESALDERPTLDFGLVIFGDELPRLLRVFNEGRGALIFAGTSIDVATEMPIGDFTMTNGRFTGTVATRSFVDLSVTFRPDPGLTDDTARHRP